MRRFRNNPKNVSIRNQICDHGRRIGHNAAMPDTIFFDLDGIAWSIDRSGVTVNHGDVAAFIAAVKRGEYHITLA